MLAAVLAIEENDLSAGPIGLLIIVLIGVATVLLIRNMSGRLKRLPPSFPEQQQPPGGERPDDDRPQVPPQR